MKSVLHASPSETDRNCEHRKHERHATILDPGDAAAMLSSSLTRPQNSTTMSGQRIIWVAFATAEVFARRPGNYRCADLPAKSARNPWGHMHSLGRPSLGLGRARKTRNRCATGVGLQANIPSTPKTPTEIRQRKTISNVFAPACDDLDRLEWSGCCLTCWT